MFFVFVIAIVVLIRIAKEQKAISAQRAAARIKAEQDRAKREAKWRAEMEREQRRLEAEQIRQAKEQARQRKEQERQAVQLAKHEEEIQRLKIRVKKRPRKLSITTRTSPTIAVAPSTPSIRNGQRLTSRFVSRAARAC